MSILDLTLNDAEAFLALNNMAVPHVNELDAAAVAALFGQASYAKQVLIDNQMAGFLLVLEPGQPYASLNYGWFSDRYDSFAYVDRIVVSEDFRGQGVGQKLYNDLADYCRDKNLPRICCEVNIEPPNPGSAAFHRQFGFVSQGSQRTEGGTKEVDLLVKELA